MSDLQQRNSNGTFKKGSYWRKPKPFWKKSWLYNMYIVKKKSTKEIGDQFNVRDVSIMHWLKKFGIGRRNVSEARKVKYWGLSKEKNPMFGKTGDKNPNWKGGVSEERQIFYASLKWKNIVPKVWKRDKAECQRCHVKKLTVNIFHIHHIVSFRIKGLRAILSNLLLVCKDCHDWIHSKENINKDFIKEVDNG